jgi:integrase
MRKRLATAGDRGNLVRLFLDDRAGVKRYVVQWGAAGARQQESWPGTKAGKLEAEAFFKAFDAEARRAATAAPERLTVRALWLAYLGAEAEHLRPNTLRLYRDAWRTWEQYITPDQIAEDITVQQIAGFRAALDARGLATATVKDAIRNVRIVFNWGERMELLARNRWHLFVHKVAKEKRTQPRAEFRSDEFLAIWSALDPDARGQWRAWVAVGLLGIYGNRQNEILNLRWSWIDGDAVRIDPSVVKTGEEGRLTLFPQTRRILDVARAWREREGYAGDVVLFPGQADGRAHASKLPHYSIQSLTDHIHRASERAGVPYIRYRAGHGFRRGLMGDLVDQTGDVTLALQAIGDRDLKMANHYRLRRNDRVDAAVQERAGRLQHPGEYATEMQSDPRNGESPTDTLVGDSLVNPSFSTTSGAD